MSVCPSTLTYFFAIAIILPHQLESHPETDWLDNIIKGLHGCHHVHTALMISQMTRDSDGVKDDVFRKVIKSMSTVTLEVTGESIQMKDLDFGTVSKLSTSLLFIFYHKYSEDNLQIHRMLRSLSDVADFSVNYLLIILRTSSNLTSVIEQVLLQAWNESIPNVVTVEIPSPADDISLSKSADHRDQVIIHQFNPFANEFHHEDFSPSIKLFRNFAKNMYARPLNVIITSRPPFSYVNWTRNNQMKTMSGPNIVLLQTLARKLNFTPIIKSRIDRNTLWQDEFLIKNYTATLAALSVDVLAHLSVRYSDDVMEETVRSRTIMKLELGVLMPKKYEINKTGVENAVENSAITFIIITIIWLAAILLKFDDNIWQLCVVFRMVFSISGCRQPSRSPERVFFLFVVVLGFMYSNDIYVSLMNLGIDPLVEIKYETFEAIDDAGLTPIMLATKSPRVISHAFGGGLDLLKKSLGSGDNQNCPQMAMAHRNVCCVIYRNEEEFYRKSVDPEGGIDQLSLTKPILWSGDAAFHFRQGLPGKGDMNRIIDRCDETGLLDKWYSNLRRSSGVKNYGNDGDQLTEVKLQARLVGQLIVVAVVGDTLATLAFIGELLSHRFGRFWKREKKIEG